MLRLETIAPSTLSLLRKIQELPEFSNTRLVGGTALALQLGHRISIDLDLFGSWPDGVDVYSALRSVGQARKTSGSPNGKLQFFNVDGVKVDCVTYSEYPWLLPPIVEEGIRLASVPDIAAMKINAITNRGTRKDFVDLAFLLEHHDIGEIFEWCSTKYPEANPALALRSMVYFADAEQQPLPRMLSPFDWDAAKDRIRSAVRMLLTDRSGR